MHLVVPVYLAGDTNLEFPLVAEASCLKVPKCIYLVAHIVFHLVAHLSFLLTCVVHLVAYCYLPSYLGLAPSRIARWVCVHPLLLLIVLHTTICFLLLINMHVVHLVV